MNSPWRGIFAVLHLAAMYGRVVRHRPNARAQKVRRAIGIAAQNRPGSAAPYALCAAHGRVQTA